MIERSGVEKVAERSAALRSMLSELDANKLEELVRHHNDAYFVRNAPEIDDDTFDKLVETLRSLSPDSDILQQVGSRTGIVRRFGIVVHDVPMLSLDKCYDDTALQKWRDRLPRPTAFLVTPKLDGLACALHYDAEGNLLRAATRGDGKVGDDITANARQVASIPSQVPPHFGRAVEVRGEVVLPIARFREAYAKDFANPRNLAAGALKHKDPEKTATYGLVFQAYDVLNLGAAVATEADKQAWLTKARFQLPDAVVVPYDGDLGAEYRRLALVRESLPFETDGVVIKVNDVTLQAELGVTAHHPRYAIAYKFQGESAHTTLREVQWSVSRSGTITPVAIVEPVFVSGATVSRASLHHVGFIAKLGLTTQARVEIVRRGGVIPKVEQVLAAVGDPVALPVQCPSCGGAVVRVDDFLFCAAPDACPDVVSARVEHFLKAIDVQGLGPKHVGGLLTKGLVRSLSDLFRLDAPKLLKLDRMGEILVQKILAELDDKRRLSLPTFLVALGLDEVGGTVADALANRFQTMDALLTADVPMVAAIHGVGPVIATAVVDGLAARADEIRDLQSVIEVVPFVPPVVAVSDHPLAGKSVVFTGKLQVLERKAAQKEVRAVGGLTPAGVSRDLDFLVVGDDGSPLLGDGVKSSKQKAAEAWLQKGAEIRILSESDFLLMLRQEA